MTICRNHRKEDPFVRLHKQPIYNKKLSWKAKGILAYAFSRPDNWKFFISEMVKNASDGEDSLKSGLKELHENGYLHKVSKKDPITGKLDGWDWHWFEEPISENDFQKIIPKGGFSVRRKPPKTGNSDPTKNEATFSKKEEKKKTTQKATALSQESLRLAVFLFEEIKNHDPNFQLSDTQRDKWALEIDRMNRIDKRSWDEIEALIIFAQADEFWRSNILSGFKLRKKATQLKMRMNKTQGTAEKKSALYEANMKFANEKLSKYCLSVLRIEENGVNIKVEGKREFVAYTEHGFHEQVDSLLRKGGHK